MDSMANSVTATGLTGALQTEESVCVTVRDSTNIDANDQDSESEKSEHSYVEIEKDIDDNMPLPEPPLFTLSKKDKKKGQTYNAIIDISKENWDEGTDTKQKAYQRLRSDKNKMFEENKIFKKYTSVFKGLKRCH